MLARTGHFMAENMLRSQLETLEKPLYALEADVGSEPAAIITRVREVLSP
jgi:gluconate kinase